MNKKKFLVIGSNSFSGSHFIKEALLQGHHVWAVSRSEEPNKVYLAYRWEISGMNRAIANDNNFNFTPVDLNTELDILKSIVNEVKPNIVVNFAAQGMVAESWENPIDWYKTNVLTQVELHEFLRTKNYLEKYVHVTTPEVYGSTDDGWIRENDYFRPSTPYAVSRAACDMHLKSFYKAYDFPVIFTRAANVYGPGQQLYRIIPRALMSALTSKPMDLHGGGRSKRSFIHITDVSKATLLLALEAKAGTTWHLSTSNSVSIKDIVKKVFDISGADFNKLVRESDERLGKDQSYLLDSTAIREAFGWSDEISFNNGLEETLEWARANLNLLKNHPWTYRHKN